MQPEKPLRLPDLRCLFIAFSTLVSFLAIFSTLNSGASGLVAFTAGISFSSRKTAMADWSAIGCNPRR